MENKIDVDEVNKCINRSIKQVLIDSKIELEKSISLIEGNESDRYSKCATSIKDIAKILNLLSKELAEPRISSPDQTESIVDKIIKRNVS